MPPRRGSRQKGMGLLRQAQESAGSCPRASVYYPRLRRPDRMSGGCDYTTETPTQPDQVKKKSFGRNDKNGNVIKIFLPPSMVPEPSLGQCCHSPRAGGISRLTSSNRTHAVIYRRRGHEISWQTREHVDFGQSILPTSHTSLVVVVDLLRSMSASRRGSKRV
jgi:hypothetical protein